MDKTAKNKNVAINEHGYIFCIVRCRDAGVHAGWVVNPMDINGREITLHDSIRLWKWHGRTLSGLALEGPDDARACKFGPTISLIRVLDACELIPCTEESYELLMSVEDWVNE